MKIKILPVYTHLKEYIAGVKSGLPAQELWEREVVAPYWDTLCCYAPMDLSARKPAPILDIETLEAQQHALETIDLSLLQAEFNRIAAALPTDDGIRFMLRCIPAITPTRRSASGKTVCGEPRCLAICC